ncbi:TIGR03085 family metal-binding protein [Corynebacterium confusum]|uniref:TIGR03085 family metal-binding protein n=1 Tax=uncultured Corynebacterium sp. TaxID=159447 RepID=UPI0025EAB180|nr:TIGR03085 family metal-binding protein [uncultured Corynebacterium sp.]
MSFSGTERNRLADLLIDLGPDAATLCEGWTTHDMAAHLWLREHRPDAAAGMFIPALSGHLVKVTKQVKEGDYVDLVNAWRAGPPKWSPFFLLGSQANFAEHFIHHEDVRRANGQTEPRDFSAAVEDQFTATLRRFAPLMLKKSRLPVILHPAGGQRIVAADKRGVAERGDAVVAISGQPAELLLWVYGRDAAQVEIAGAESAIVKSSL